jgi:hypothetical protein
MAVTSKVLARTAAATSETDLYTVPNTTTTTIVTDIIITNTTTSAATFSLLIDTVSIASGVAAPAADSLFVSLKQVIPADATPKKIRGNASTTAVNFHISGVEIS